MKTLAFISVLLPMIFAFTGAETVKKLAVGKESKISILGSSNVNQFSLEAGKYHGNDTLVLTQKANNGAVFTKGVLRIPAVDFKNANPILTKDFRKVIKAKTFPEIIMNFKNINVYPCSKDMAVNGVAEVEIFLAGKWKSAKLNVRACRNGNLIIINGNTKLCFTDFALTAPEKVMGFIDVNDDLQVNFQLSLKEI